VLPATLEDLDLSASRGLDRRLVFYLAQGDRFDLVGESRRKADSPLAMPPT
jgi:hypothetical protein